ncbi:fetuin-B [Tachyglossus aculeatus]|uniref:fetuin-B n=1 Tax=Tachyglossus aculeatus TaxID=9261 RepID=UPI0018F64982|nr:fetuin-B [Tachyglossus aculeatus]
MSWRFASLLLCILASGCWATISSQGLLPQLLSPGCNHSQVLAAAGFALEQINADQKEGYELSLNQVINVHEHRQDFGGSVYYLTMAVLETRCHVLSRKPWKNCETRRLHESVYGKCKAIFHLSLTRRILNLLAYNCTLRPVSRKKIVSMCPDCPTTISTTDNSAIAAATESLAKYNALETKSKYSLLKITKASMQWVFGANYFVEYLIGELPCSSSPSNPGICLLHLEDTNPVGLCVGSMRSKRDEENSVSVSCNLFEKQGSDPRKERPGAGHGSGHQHEHHDGHGHGHRNKTHPRPHPGQPHDHPHGHRPGHQHEHGNKTHPRPHPGSPHDHPHGHRPGHQHEHRNKTHLRPHPGPPHGHPHGHRPGHRPEHQNHTHPRPHPSPPHGHPHHHVSGKPQRPVGSIQILPALDGEPGEAPQQVPFPVQVTWTSHPEAGHQDFPENHPVVLQFPEERAEGCPGTPKEGNHLILPS